MRHNALLAAAAAGHVYTHTGGTDVLASPRDIATTKAVLAKAGVLAGEHYTAIYSHMVRGTQAAAVMHSRAARPGCVVADVPHKHEGVPVLTGRPCICFGQGGAWDGLHVRRMDAVVVVVPGQGSLGARHVCPNVCHHNHVLHSASDSAATLPALCHPALQDFIWDIGAARTVYPMVLSSLARFKPSQAG